MLMMYRCAMTAAFQSEAMELPGDVAAAHQEKQLNMNTCSLLYCCKMAAVFQSEAMDLPGDVAVS